MSKNGIYGSVFEKNKRFVLKGPSGNGLILFALLLLSVCSGCTWLIAPPVDDASARYEVDRFQHQNRNMAQAKGLLRLRLSGGPDPIAGRVAWALSMPDRLRIEWLSMMGQPMFALSGDGNTLLIRSYADDEVHRMQQTPTVLQRFLHVPIGIEELNRLLVGRAPLPPFEAVQRAPDESGSRGYLFKNRWRTPLATLLTDDLGRPSRMERFNDQGDLRYRIFWINGPLPRNTCLPGRSGLKRKTAMPFI